MACLIQVKLKGGRALEGILHGENGVPLHRLAAACDANDPSVEFAILLRPISACDALVTEIEPSLMNPGLSENPPFVTYEYVSLNALDDMGYPLLSVLLSNPLDEHVMLVRD